MRALTAAFPLLACCALASCETTEIPNAPPELVEDCRREVALITEREPDLAGMERVPGGEAGPTDDILDDARAAREEAGEEGLAAWPEDALLYRCLASRGVQLTDEQARILAEWEARPDADEPE